MVFALLGPPLACQRWLICNSDSCCVATEKQAGSWIFYGAVKRLMTSLVPGARSQDVVPRVPGTTSTAEPMDETSHCQGSLMGMHCVVDVHVLNNALEKRCAVSRRTDVCVWQSSGGRWGRGRGQRLSPFTSSCQMRFPDEHPGGSGTTGFLRTLTEILTARLTLTSPGCQDLFLAWPLDAHILDFYNPRKMPFFYWHSGI